MTSERREYPTPMSGSDDYWSRNRDADGVEGSYSSGSNAWRRSDNQRDRGRVTPYATTSGRGRPGQYDYDSSQWGDQSGWSSGRPGNGKGA